MTSPHDRVPAASAVSLVRPFRGLRPTPAYAERVAAPPYDVLDSDEARARVKDNPWSFLHVSKAEVDLPPGTDHYAPEVYAKAAENFRRMIEAGVLVRDEAPCYYVYRLVMDAHVQTGVVVAASVCAYEAELIRKHEFTRPDKEDDRVRQIEAVGAQTGPVFLVHRPLAEVSAVIDEVTHQGPPAFSLTAANGVRHALWVVADAPRIARLTAALDGAGMLYIADGHHRSAAASRVAQNRRAEGRGCQDQDPLNAFLAVTFPADEMQVLDYNRVVRDLHGLDEATFLGRLAEDFTVEAVRHRAKPSARNTFGLYLPGRWYRLCLRPEVGQPDDPVARLDVSILTDRILAPILGITDLRRDPRIDFVGGVRGLDELERRVDGGGMAAAFALFPTSMNDLLTVADAGQIMPPKSTWFEPKLADGLVSYLLD